MNIFEAKPVPEGLAEIPDGYTYVGQLKDFTGQILGIIYDPVDFTWTRPSKWPGTKGVSPDRVGHWHICVASGCVTEPEDDPSDGRPAGLRPEQRLALMEEHLREISARPHVSTVDVSGDTGHAFYRVGLRRGRTDGITDYAGHLLNTFFN